MLTYHCDIKLTLIPISNPVRLLLGPPGSAKVLQGSWEKDESGHSDARNPSCCRKITLFRKLYPDHPDTSQNPTNHFYECFPHSIGARSSTLPQMHSRCSKAVACEMKIRSKPSIPCPQLELKWSCRNAILNWIDFGRSWTHRKKVWSVFSSTSRARNLKKFFDKSEEAPNPPKKTRGPKDPKEPPHEKDTKGDGSKKNKGPETDEPEKPKRRRKQWSVWIKDGLILINTGGSVLLHRLVFSNLGF